MHLAEVLAWSWGCSAQQRKQLVKKCLFCVQWDTAEVVTVSFLSETWSGDHLHALTWPSVLTDRMMTASSDLYSFVSVMSDNVGSDGEVHIRFEWEKGLRKIDNISGKSRVTECTAVIFPVQHQIMWDNVWKYVTFFLHIIHVSH